MNFGDAVEAAKSGKRVAREGWNGKGMFVFLHVVSITGAPVPALGLKIEPCFVMKTAQNTLVPGWLASQTDMLANDWLVAG